MARLKCSVVNTRMIASKITFFFCGGHLGSYIAFLNVFFISVGLSKFRAGVITGLMYAPPIIAGPLWGYIADRTGRRKLVLLILCVGSSFLTFSMPWVAHSIYPKSQYKCNITVRANGSDWTNTSELITPTMDMNCVDVRDKAIYTLFWVLLTIMISASIFLVPLPSYIDTLVINVVKSGKQDATYGAQRIFGSIGISLGNFLAGRTADQYETDMSPYTAVFFYFLPCTLLLLPTGSYLIGQVDERDTLTGENDDQKEESDASTDEVHCVTNQESQLKQVFSLFRRFDVTFFMCTVFVSGLANNLFLNFSYVLVTDVLKRNKTEMTFVIIMATISETLFFPFTSKVMTMLRGPIPAIILGTVSHFVRFFIMSCKVPFWVVVGVQVLSAPAFALSWSAFIEQVHIFSPKRINVTMNAVMMMVFHGVGNFIANILGAKIYESYGGRKLFFGQSLICLVWSLVMMIYYGSKRLRKFRNNTKHEQECEPVCQERPGDVLLAGDEDHKV